MITARQKILGIDYGDQRVGLSLAESNSMAVPYQVIANNNPEDLIKQLQDVIKAEDVKVVVVGLPHSLSGQPNQRLQITQEFVDYLKANLAIDIQTVDEQLTSKLYAKMGVKKDIDKHAATAILDTWLANQQNND
jgi:putative holliday junction resolvase